MTGFLLTAKQKLMLCINKRLYWNDKPRTPVVMEKVEIV